MSQGQGLYYRCLQADAKETCKTFDFASPPPKGRSAPAAPRPRNSNAIRGFSIGEVAEDGAEDRYDGRVVLL